MEAPKQVNRSFTGGMISTHWSAIRACVGDNQSAQAAREQLCRDYWYPVYTYVRRFGQQSSDAEDLTQDFFAYILRADWLARADQKKGRFRSFLLSSLENFLRDQHDIRKALRREGSYRHVPLDLANARSLYARTAATSISADDAYDFEWANTLVNGALRKLETEYTAAGKLPAYKALVVFLLSEGDTALYEKAARQLGTSADGIRVAVHRLRKAYAAMLKEEVKRIVASPEEVADEMNYLRRVFAAKMIVAA